MYKGIDVVSLAEENANKEVLQERRQYNIYLSSIEKYLSKNKKKIVVSGKNGLALLLDDRAQTRDSYVYELYSTNPAKHTKEIAIALYGLGQPYLISIITRLPKKDYTIEVNARAIVRISSILLSKSADILSLVKPTPRKGLFSNVPLHCLSSHLYLIELYGNLCNPSLAKEWKNQLLIEEKLIRLINKPNEKEKEKAKAIEEKDNVSLYSDFESIGKLDRVKLGIGRYCTFIPLDSEEKTIRNLAREKNISIKTSINNIKIPTFRRLTALTICDSSNKLLFELYDNPLYELVPFILGPENQRLATWPCLLRFLLVELWIVNLLDNIGFKQIRRTAPEILSEFFIQRETKREFSLKYIGRLEDPQLAQKRYLSDRMKRGIKPMVVDKMLN